MSAGEIVPYQPSSALLPVERLTTSDARRLTDEVKADAKALWMKILRLHDGEAHLALGYTSWHAFCDAELGIAQSHAYRLLNAGRVHALIPQLENEAQARELAPLLREGDDAVLEFWHAYQDEHGDAVTAKTIRLYRSETEKLKRKLEVRGKTSRPSSRREDDPVLFALPPTDEIRDDDHAKHPEHECRHCGHVWNQPCPKCGGHDWHDVEGVQLGLDWTDG